jgi:hypothetical protein
MKTIIPIIIPLLLFLTVSVSTAQTTVSLTADRDNTLYEDTTGGLSNGAGNGLFIGKTGISNGNMLRRALIRFDLTSLPANATVTNVSLTIQVNKVNNSNSSSTALYKVSSDWGEGNSSATGNQGQGASSATNDATWIHTFYNTSTWTNAGGDYSSTSSATASIGTTGAYSYTSSSMVSDVQGWINSSSSNYGWILLGDESTNNSAKRIASREFGTAANRPTLRVTYTVSTGLAENKQSTEIKMYPNPATDHLVIDHRRNMFNNFVTIYDLTGKLLMRKYLEMDNRLDISELKNGIYFIEMELNNGKDRFIRKFIKQ